MSLSLSLLLSVGQVVNIKAKVNRAFNTSMEVRQVHISTNTHTHTHTHTKTNMHSGFVYMVTIIPLFFLLCSKLVRQELT